MWATSVLQSRLEAEVLLAHILQRERAYLYTWPDKPLTVLELTQFKDLVIRREQGEPIAYIIGQKEFWSQPLHISDAVLIPRPETESLVEQVLHYLPRHNSNIRILELGTGSGAVALSLAKECPAWQIVATDISEAALQVAQFNAKTLDESNITWLQGEWYEALSSLEPKQRIFNAIVSNPPYISEDDPHLFQGDLRYEPKNALVSGETGLEALKHIIMEAPKYLENHAALFLEHGATQAASLCDLLETTGFTGVKTIKDLAGVNRVTLGFYEKKQLI